MLFNKEQESNPLSFMLNEFETFPQQKKGFTTTNFFENKET